LWFKHIKGETKISPFFISVTIDIQYLLHITITIDKAVCIAAAGTLAYSGVVDSYNSKIPA
jgi:hypothetical protein